LANFNGGWTSLLPSAHIADRVTAIYESAVTGAQVTYVADPKAILGALVDCQRGQSLTQEDRTHWKRADTLVLANLRSAIGLDQCRVAWTGAAALAPATVEFFLAIGVNLCEIWGMSELTGLTTVNAPGQEDRDDRAPRARHTGQARRRRRDHDARATGHEVVFSREPRARRR
jgi:long-subunit acyl-CoA synthetase (AMP-forming)